MMKNVLSFGELLWDILPTVTILGGAPFNFAYRVNSLGDVGGMVSRLGRDELGKKAHAKVVELGIDTRLLQWDERYPTGTVDVSFDKNNNPDYVINPGVAYDHIELNGVLTEAAKRADCLCFGTLIQRSPQSRETLEKLIQFSPASLKLLDINLRKKCYSFETIIFSLENANILKLNEDEARTIAEIVHIAGINLPDFCENMLERWSLDYCLVTMAEKGAYAKSRQGAPVYIPGYKVKLIDSLGAGDAFSAGFVHKILRGASLHEACTFGNLLGGIVATQAGATGSIGRADIAQFLEKDYDRNYHPDLEAYLW